MVEMVATREDDDSPFTLRHANWAIQQSGRRNKILKRSEAGRKVSQQVRILRILHVRRTLVVKFQTSMCAQKRFNGF
jgi:hypothetical protein